MPGRKCRSKLSEICPKVEPASFQPSVHRQLSPLNDLKHFVDSFYDDQEQFSPYIVIRILQQLMLIGPKSNILLEKCMLIKSI